ncbi:MAG: OB-fold domain-containing protein [Deltaproteobacteria bacterium]|jgi:uncharacterized OB-fold protein|nr:OB-fold domain-containing protein [Deltaproteobacteria bacterium]
MTETATPQPLPQLTGFSKDFYGFCKQRELRFQRCKTCGEWRHVPREMCTGCGSFEWEWAQSAGRGTVFTWCVVERALHPGWVAAQPYAVVVVELDEEVRLVTQVNDVSPAELEMGMAVEVVFDDVTPDITLPHFRRRSG